MTTILRGHAWLSAMLASSLLVTEPAAAASGLRPETVHGWTTYIAATVARRAREADASRRSTGFLALDFGPHAGSDRRDVLRGLVVVRQAKTSHANGNEIDVPLATVHHWRGAVLLAGATIDRVMAALHAGPPLQEDVLHARVLDRTADRMRIFLRLRRSKVVTVVYNTEHAVTFSRLTAGRATSDSTATRIAEVRDPGTPREAELAPGDDRGFLWRLDAYWRYEQVGAGVIAECESVSLSRAIPFGLRQVIRPLVTSAARESMERTLLALRAHLAT
jgi:hypothetical protein